MILNITRTPRKLGGAQSITGSRVVHRIGGTAALRSFDDPLEEYRSKNEGNVKGSDSVNPEAGHTGDPDPGVPI